MERLKEGGGEKKNMLAKTIERCRSLGHRRRPGGAAAGQWAVPAGCFAVLVGPEKERFAVRAERANRPLFRALLDEAEAAYGFAGGCAGGPLELPCGVEVFREVMWELEQEEAAAAAPMCRFSSPGGSRASHGYRMTSPGPARFVAGRS